jgi:hypothetical protein
MGDFLIRPRAGVDFVRFGESKRTLVEPPEYYCKIASE